MEIVLERVRKELSMYDVFGEFQKEYYDRNLISAEERVKKLYDTLYVSVSSEKDKKEILLLKNDDEYSQWLLEHISSKRYQNKHFKGKNDKLFEKEPFNRAIERMANYILAGEIQDDAIQYFAEQYPTLSDNKAENNQVREIDYDTLYEKIDSKVIISEDDVFMNKATRLSEKKKRKIRELERDKYMDRYRELREIQSNINAINHRLSIDANNEQKLLRLKEEALNKWELGLARVDLLNVKRLDEIKVNSTTKPIENEDELEKKWLQVLKYYGLSPSNKSNQSRLRKVRNELSYESFFVREQLRKPITFKQIGKGSTRYDFEQDTGYFYDIYVNGVLVEYGDWKEVRYKQQ